MISTAAASFQLHTAEQVSKEALGRFYSRMFPARADFLKAHWRWLYRVGAYRSIRSPLLAVSKGEIVGHAGFIPAVLRCNDKEHLAIWFVDFAVLPEYQRNNVGSILARAGMSMCPLQLGFGNEQSVPMFSRLSWTTRFHTTGFRLVLQPDRNPAWKTSVRCGLAAALGLGTRIALRAITSGAPNVPAAPVNGETLAEFSEPGRSSQIQCSRSAEFLRWRILKHPCREQYFVLSARDRANRCSAVARVVSDAGYLRLHLLTLHRNTSDSRSLSRFFSGVIRWALDHSIHHVLLISNESNVGNVAKFWFPMTKRLSLVYHANDLPAAEFISGADHSWECLDSDFDLTY